MSWISIADMINLENEFNACFKGSNIGYDFNKRWNWGIMKFQESTLNDLFYGVIIKTIYLVCVFENITSWFLSNELLWYNEWFFYKH